MSPTLRDWQLTQLAKRLHEQQPITLRRCLGCDGWLRSTGPDHRLCNACKGVDGRWTHAGGRV